MDPGVLAAIVTAAASMIVAIFTYVSTSKAQNDLERQASENKTQLEKYKHILDIQRSANQARLDYEYEARKRLYEKCEPVLFQLFEACEGVLFRLYRIAELARDGELDRPGNTWLSKSDVSYFLLATVYTFMCPIVMFRLLRRTLTFIDFSVDRHVKIQYLLSKQIYFVLTEHWEISKDYQPALPYMPETEKMQGVPLGWLDSAADALLVQEPNGATRVMTIGEFVGAYWNNKGNFQDRFTVMLDLFDRFHPRTYPILWRVLIVYAMLCQKLIQERLDEGRWLGGSYQRLNISLPENRKRLDWRCKEEQVPEEGVLSQPFEVAERYIQRTIGGDLPEEAPPTLGQPERVSGG